MDIFIGNLSFEAKEEDLYKLFMPFRKVSYLSIVMDKNGVKSRGFAFLEMPDEAEAKVAIAALHGKVVMGRPINVEQALSKRPKDELDAQSPGMRSKGAGYKQGRRSRNFRKRQKTSIKRGPPLPS